MSRWHRRLAAAPALTVALIVSACGIATTGPHAIPKSQLPNIAAGATPTTAPNADFISVTIVLLQASSNAPVAVNRFVPPQADRLATVLSDLLLGAEAKEQQQGLFSAIPTTTRLRSVTPANLAPDSIPDSIITVDLSQDFTAISGLAQELEVQQVVSTVSCFFSPSSTPRVLFKVEGEPLPVPIATGISVSRPVTVADYGAADCSTTS
jgi:spore germination protein GerM